MHRAHLPVLREALRAGDGRHSPIPAIFSTSNTNQKWSRSHANALAAERLGDTDGGMLEETKKKASGILDEVLGDGGQVAVAKQFRQSLDNENFLNFLQRKTTNFRRNRWFPWQREKGAATRH